MKAKSLAVTNLSSVVKVIEAKPGEVKVDDIQPDTMEMLLHYLYHEQVTDLKKINLKLLCAADKYNVVELVEVCSDTLKRNVSLANECHRFTCFGTSHKSKGSV